MLESSNLTTFKETKEPMARAASSVLLCRPASSNMLPRAASSSMIFSPVACSPTAPISVAQVLTEEVSCTWSRGLTGQQFSLDTSKGQQHLEKACPLTDIYKFDKHEIGHGAYGICVPAKHKASSTSCVVKIIEKKKAGKSYLDNMEEKGKDIYNIFLSMSAERHPNVVRYLDFLIGSSLILVIMEPLRGPELFKYISEFDSFPESQCRNIMRQVLAGVSCCHKWGLIHRDVKLENFRFRDADDRSTGLTLLDFGLCCPVHPHEKRDLVGTLLYTAPEMSSGEYSTPVDMWATGVMLYVMLVGSFPFEHQSYEGTDNSYRSGKRLREALRKLEEQNLPTEAVDLVKSLLVRNPDGRLTADQSLKHFWFRAEVPEASLLDGDSVLSPTGYGRLSRRDSYTSCRTMSTLAPQLHASISDMRLKSICSQDEKSEGSLPSIAECQSRPCHAIMGTLLSNKTPCNIIFLDVDGVLAPCVNCGQIVRQCVQGVVTLCKAAKARIVLSSSWRLLDGKVELLNSLFQQHDTASVIFDVTPDLYSHELPEDALPEFDNKSFVRCNDKKGFSLENALKASEVFGINDNQTKESFGEVFNDPDFDLHVFSEDAGEYTQECFSPRSRRAADWVHEQCSVKFAETRCREIMFWLFLAKKSGFAVNKWVVLDDDDLLKTGNDDAGPQARMRTGNFGYSMVGQEAVQKTQQIEASAPKIEASAPVAAADVAIKVIDEVFDDDDPWSMAF